MLKVNEVFGPTIQGEGKSQGLEVMFVRLSFCNLKCVWCDTKYTWDWSQYDRNIEVRTMTTDEVLQRLVASKCKAVVISGGEPMLQQNSMLGLLSELYRNEFWTEVETNGTIAPVDEFSRLISQFNCSPKLSNSGDSEKMRLNPKSLHALSMIGKAFFKFVISSSKDIAEVISIIKSYSISPDRVYLMPLGKTIEELGVTTSIVKTIARDEGFNFSSRLHVETWGSKRGV